ncbi:MAG TPA: hypothetical protein VMU47_10950 [Caldimonas sp.]|nr:hypothetical protein [Caldimonas sp.]
MSKTLEEMTLPELLDHTRKLEKDNGLIAPLLSDPATRSEALKLLKKKHPTMSIPEIDVKVEAEALVAEERKKREEADERLRLVEMRERWREERARVQSQYELSDADMAEVEALMRDEKAPIPHYDAAVKVWRASQRTAEPTSSQLQSHSYEMPSKDKWGAGVGNKMALNKIFENEAYAVVNEMRGGKKAA